MTAILSQTALLSPADRDTWLSFLLARCGVVEWAEDQGGIGPAPASRIFLLPVLVNTNTGFSDH